MTKAEMKILRMNILGGMHQYIIEMGDEDIYTAWTMGGVPDEPTEDDLEYIATDNEEWRWCCELFGKLVEKYDKDW